MQIGKGGFLSTVIQQHIPQESWIWRFWIAMRICCRRKRLQIGNIIFWLPDERMKNSLRSKKGTAVDKIQGTQKDRIQDNTAWFSVYFHHFFIACPKLGLVIELYAVDVFFIVIWDKGYWINSRRKWGYWHSFFYICCLKNVTSI